MAITPLDETTADTLAYIIDNVSVEILAHEYATEQMKKGLFTYEQAKKYMHIAEERIERREDMLGDERAYIWSDLSKHSLFLSLAFTTAVDIINARLLHEDAGKINKLIRELDQNIADARAMCDRREMQDKALLALETCKIAATAEKEMTIDEAKELAAKQRG